MSADLSNVVKPLNSWPYHAQSVYRAHHNGQGDGSAQHFGQAVTKTLGEQMECVKRSLYD